MSRFTLIGGKSLNFIFYFKHGYAEVDLPIDYPMKHLELPSVDCCLQNAQLTLENSCIMSLMSWWVQFSNVKFCKNFRVQFREIHPFKVPLSSLTWHWRKSLFSIGTPSSNSRFSIVMLFFFGRYPEKVTVFCVSLLRIFLETNRRFAEGGIRVLVMEDSLRSW